MSKEKGEGFWGRAASRLMTKNTILIKALEECRDWHRDRGTGGLYFDKPTKTEHRKMMKMIMEALSEAS